MMNPLPGFDVAKEKRRDLERELAHRRLIKELENKDISEQSRLIIGASSIVMGVMILVQFFVTN